MGIATVACVIVRLPPAIVHLDPLRYAPRNDTHFSIPCCHCEPARQRREAMRAQVVGVRHLCIFARYWRRVAAAISCSGGLNSPPINISSVSFRVCYCAPVPYFRMSLRGCEAAVAIRTLSMKRVFSRYVKGNGLPRQCALLLAMTF